jgi:hypothetical protein
MTTTTLTGQKRASLADSVPTLWLVLGMIALTIIALVISTALSSSQAAAEAATAGEESSFELDDMYETWSWIIVIGTFATATVYGLKQRWSFASTIQIALIIVLTVNFILIAQTIDRDIFGVGIFALIIFTLIQIAFGNISPQANFRQSMIGLVIAAVIISVVIGLSIWLAPSLVQLGQR